MYLPVKRNCKDSVVPPISDEQSEVRVVDGEGAEVSVPQDALGRRVVVHAVGHVRQVQPVQAAALHAPQRPEYVADTINNHHRSFYNLLKQPYRSNQTTKNQETRRHVT